MAAHLTVEKQGHVTVVTLDRPEARNAYSPEMLARLADAWAAIDADAEVRAAILTGAGGHFCAGADLKWMAAGWGSDPVYGPRFRDDPQLAWRALLRGHGLKKPLVAAIEGSAIAGGTELVLGTDIRVAAAGARFGLAEARWGLFPLGGSTVRLPRQVPRTVALELLLTGRTIAADEALRMGLVGRVVPDGQALAEARAIAEQIAANGPLAVQAIKRAVVETADLPEPEALARELAIGQPVFATADAQEGPRAFVEKRKPRFRGQ
jgi:enoyl-CoA hydratase